MYSTRLTLPKQVNRFVKRSFIKTPAKSLILSQLRQYRLVALSGHDTAVRKETEVTLYIKGFIARKGSSDNYEGWWASHRELVAKENWSRKANAFYWESEKIHMIPAYSIGYLVYKIAKLRAIHPIGLLTAVLGDAVLIGVQALNEYRNIEDTIKYNLKPLVEYLKEFSAEYDTVRVVAHSTGCKLLTEALREISPDKRPHFVHLCAPALTEREIQQDLPSLAQRQTSVYYCKSRNSCFLKRMRLSNISVVLAPRDLILNAAYTVFWQDDPVGVVGLKQSYPNVKTVDVDRYFDFSVHNNYASKFHLFATEYMDITDIKNRPDDVLKYIQDRDGIRSSESGSEQVQK